MDSIVGVRGGTTLEIIVPWISPAKIPDSRVSDVKTIPYSSAVFVCSVDRRQELRRVCPSNTPETIWVLPMSIVRSMERFPLTLHPSPSPYFPINAGNGEGGWD